MLLDGCLSLVLSVPGALLSRRAGAGARAASGGPPRRSSGRLQAPWARAARRARAAGDAALRPGLDPARAERDLFTDAKWRLRSAANALDPTAWRATRMWGGPPPEAGALVCIYRERYVPVVQRLVTEAQDLGLAVALWALDGVSEPLSGVTLGTGPGRRLALLNRLYEAVAPRLRGPLVFSDDDVVFVRGGLGRLLRAVTHCGFAIAQPAHAAGSQMSYEFTRVRPLTLARRTTFVEIGPMVVVSESWRHRVLPFPDDFGMGWGLDLLWHDLAREGCQLGIVDAVTIRHLATPGAAYDTDVEQQRLVALMRMRSLSNLRDIQRCLGVWRAWQARPPWDVLAVPPAG
jgi:hypothetical protein